MPDFYGANAGVPGSQTSFLLDASAEKVAFIFRAPKAGTLSKVRFRTSTVTTGDTMKVSFQDVDGTTGDPDGVVDQFRTIAIGNNDDNVTLQTGIISSDGTDGGTKRTVTLGQMLAVVIEFNSYVAGNLNIVGRSSVVPAGTSNDVYVDHFTSAWAKSAAVVPRFALEYSDGSYAAITMVDPGIGGTATETYNSGTLSGAGGDERALLFQVPFPCKVSGFYGIFDVDGNADVVLYDSGGATLESLTLDSDVRAQTFAMPLHAHFDTEVTLAKDTTYYLAFKPTSVTTVGLVVTTYSAAAVMDSLPGGQQCHYAARTDAGAWSPDTTKRPHMGVIISALDDGISGGGLRIIGPGGLVA